MSKEWVESHKTVCIDFNGVLDTYTGWRGPDFMYPMRPGANEFLYNLHEAGYNVVIFTAADPGNVTKWLIDYDLLKYVDVITDKKVPALIYIDDRAIEFRGDFEYTLTQVLRFKTYWETAENHEGGRL